MSSPPQRRRGAGQGPAYARSSAVGGVLPAGGRRVGNWVRRLRLCTQLRLLRPVLSIVVAGPLSTPVAQKVPRGRRGAERRDDPGPGALRLRPPDSPSGLGRGSPLPADPGLSHPSTSRLLFCLTKPRFRQTAPRVPSDGILVPSDGTKLGRRRRGESPPRVSSVTFRRGEGRPSRHLALGLNETRKLVSLVTSDRIAVTSDGILVSSDGTARDVRGRSPGAGPWRPRPCRPRCP